MTTRIEWTVGDPLAGCDALDAYRALVALCDRLNVYHGGMDGYASNGRARPVSSVPPVVNADAPPDGLERRRSGKARRCVRVSPSVRNRTTA